MLKHLPIFGNEQLLRLFRYLPPYKWYLIGAGLAMVAGGGASSLIALILGKLTDMGFYQRIRWFFTWRRSRSSVFRFCTAVLSI